MVHCTVITCIITFTITEVKSQPGTPGLYVGAVVSYIRLKYRFHKFCFRIGVCCNLSFFSNFQIIFSIVVVVVVRSSSPLFLNTLYRTLLEMKLSFSQGKQFIIQ